MSVYKYIDDIKEIDLNSGYTEYMCMCPNCKRLGKKVEDHKLGISLSKNVFHCYRCSWSGSVDYLLNGVVSGRDLLEFKFRDFKENKEQLLNSEILDYDNVATKIDEYCYDAITYLKNRGFTKEDIEKYDIRLGKGLYQGRLTIPVYDDYKNVVYLTARDHINKNNPLRYINPPESHKSLFVWNLNNVNSGNKIILTEGVFSGMAADKVSDEFTAVCIFGKSISDKQVKLISKKSPSEIVLSFDGDVPVKEVKKNYDKIRMYCQGKVTVLRLYGKEDPNSISCEEYYSRLVNREPINDYLLGID